MLPIKPLKSALIIGSFGLLSSLIATPLLWSQLPSRKVLQSDIALGIAQASLAKCRADGNRVVVTVVDAGNFIMVVLRDDNAPLSSLEVGRMKATSVILMGRASGPPPNLVPGQPMPSPSIPGTTYAMGGVPIKVDDQIIGAVSVSGAPSGDKDAACAASGIATMANTLK